MPLSTSASLRFLRAHQIATKEAPPTQAPARLAPTAIPTTGTDLLPRSGPPQSRGNRSMGCPWKEAEAVWPGSPEGSSAVELYTNKMEDRFPHRPHPRDMGSRYRRMPISVPFGGSHLSEKRLASLCRRLSAVKLGRGPFSWL